MAFADDRYIHMYPSAVKLKNAAGVEVLLDSNSFSLDEQFTTLTTQGTVTTHEKDILDRMLANINNQVFQAALNEAMLGAATTTGVTGVAARWGYDGTYDSGFYQLTVEITGTDLDDGTDVTFRVIIWKLSPKQYRPLATLTAKQVVEQTAQFTASRTLTDVAGAAIVGLRDAVNGDYLSVDKMAAA